ncbi:MAG: S8 family serine peptidase, partial [Rhodothermales bacterium]
MIKLRLLPALLLILTLARCSSTRPPVAETNVPRTEAAADTSAAQPEAQPPAETATAEVAPTEAPDEWFLLDATDGGFPGVSVDKAYAALEGKEPARTVVVAVIDSGIDIEHEDLEGKIWTNEDEIPDNGVDDDENGYVDDVHGWNFIGGEDGSNVDYDTFELTREYVKLGEE